MSSTLNSLAAVTVEDYIKPLYKKIKKSEWESTSAATSKLIAFIYGLVCIGGAFLAQFLGGILQASLILFGVVGGPLLGLFTLGMTTESAVEWGVVPALIIGIAFSTWVGFSPKPLPDRQLEFSTEDCSEFGGFNKTTTSDPVEEKEFFYLFRLSYIYAAFIGFVVTFVIGFILSYILRAMKKQGKERIFTDSTKTTINPDLFLPPIAKSIRRRNLAFELKSRKDSNEKY